MFQKLGSDYEGTGLAYPFPHWDLRTDSPRRILTFIPTCMLEPLFSPEKSLISLAFLMNGAGEGNRTLVSLVKLVQFVRL